MEKFFEVSVTTLSLLNVLIMFYLVKLAASMFLEIHNYFKLQSAVKAFKSLMADGTFTRDNQTKH